MLDGESSWSPANLVILVLVAVSFAGLLAACDQDTIRPSDQDDLSHRDTSFWPLALGNEWRYYLPITGDSNIYYRVTAERTFEDSLTFYLVAREGGPFHTWDTLLLRYRKPDVIERLVNGKREDYITFLDTNRNEFDNSWPAKVSKGVTELDIAAGRFKCTTIIFGSSEPGFEAYSRGYGMIEYNWGFTLWLLSAKVK